jgi:outer membrane immunogenic protein
MKRLLATCAAIAGLLAASPSWGADLPLKAPPAPVAPAWTGFYAGVQVGGGWGNRNVNYTANDLAAATLLGGLIGFPGEQPVAPNSFSMSGITGGIEAGYNWQLGRSWLIGVEADFSGSGIKGQGSTTSLLSTAPLVPQSVAEKQSIDWYGTVRARFGWLATDDLLLFATGGFAYGKVADTLSYSTGGPPGLIFGVAFPSGSFSCVSGTTCFAGASSSLRTGWTAGAGGEWRFARAWSVKAEYQYVNLGSDTVTATAFVPLAGQPLASFNANLGHADFHVARVGVNFHF